MKCKERKIGGAVVVDVDGKLTGVVGTDEFHGLIKRLLSEGEKRIVINLEKTPWATSQGIGLLIGALTSVTNAGGRLVLAHTCRRIQETLRVTKLFLIFESFTTIEEAVEQVLVGSTGSAAASVAGLRPIILA